jgi:hypothetical protein
MKIKRMIKKLKMMILKRTRRSKMMKTKMRELRWRKLWRMIIQTK